MQLLQGVSQSMKTVSGNSSADDLARVSSELVQVKDRVREKLQAATAGDLSKILEKLDNKELLTPAEKDLVGFWLVGDAEGFTKMEAEFSDWQGEFRRLTGMIDSFAGQDDSPQNLVEVHGVLQDAIRVAADIAFFVEEKDRVEKFNAAINNLTPDDAKFLAEMLRVHAVQDRHVVRGWPGLPRVPGRQP